MDPKTRLLLSQLQLTGLGIIVGVIGWMYDKTIFVYIGIAIFVLGLIRVIMVRKMLDGMDIEDQNLNDYRIHFSRDEDEEDDWQD